MSEQVIPYEPDYAVPPGETLLEALEEARLTREELARLADLSTKHVSRLVSGHVALTPETAVRLEWVLGIPARFWNAREANYRARLANKEEHA